MLRVLNKTLKHGFAKKPSTSTQVLLKQFSMSAAINPKTSHMHPSAQIKSQGKVANPMTTPIEELDITAKYEFVPTNNRLLERIMVKVALPTKKELIDLLEISEDTQQTFEFIYKFLDLNKNNTDIDLYNVCAVMFGKKFITSQLMVDKKPVVCIMGHVDHGKTTLLDYYRHTSVAAKEVGGITQKIGGFTLSTKNGQVSFIDTPGHELFSNMRETGVNCADIVVMIVSATEGVKPQTKEVFSLIKQYKLPYIVAVNKIDLPNADVEKVEEELIELGAELEPYGGDVPVIHISAKTGQNLDLLLELIVEESDRLKLAADVRNQPELRAIESKSNTSNELCKTSIVVKNGSLQVGQHLVFEDNWMKLMAMKNSKGESIETADPGDIIEILGINKLPQSSQSLLGFSSEKYCKLYVAVNEKLRAIKVQNRVADEDRGKVVIRYKNGRDKRKAYSNEANMVKRMMLARDELIIDLTDESLPTDKRAKLQKNLLELNRQINSFRVDENETHVIIKASDIGTVQTIDNYLKGYEKMNFNVMSIGCGELTSSEIEMAGENEAEVYLFDLKITEKTESLLKTHNVNYHTYSIIYKLFEKLEDLNNKTVQSFEVLDSSTLGSGCVLKVFNIPVKEGKPVKICGSKVDNGYFQIDAKFKILRNKQIVASDLKAVSLKRFKKEVDRVEEGHEFGITFDGFNDFEEGDAIECYF